MTHAHAPSPTASSLIQDSKTIIIKIGSALIYDPKTGSTRDEWLSALASDVLSLRSKGKRVLIVSSGGVALGRRALDIGTDTPPTKIPLAKKQAASAYGQTEMMVAYKRAFAPHDVRVSQALLTITESRERISYLNTRDALDAMCRAGIIPIINENDVTSTEELRFGDNDCLSVRVGQIVAADTVVLLSTAAGLFTANPDTDPSAEHIPHIAKLDSTHFNMAGDAVAGPSTGGMRSKLAAADLAMPNGINLIITDGRTNHSLDALCHDANKIATCFTRTQSRKQAKKDFIAGAPSKAALIIDDGAYAALFQGRSLLPVGVSQLEGDFQRGDTVSIKTRAGNIIGKGIVSYSAAESQRMIGKKSADLRAQLPYIGRPELIHRDDMALRA